MAALVFGADARDVVKSTRKLSGYTIADVTVTREGYPYHVVTVSRSRTNVWRSPEYLECFWEVATSRAAKTNDFIYLHVNGMIDVRLYRADFYLVQLHPTFKPIATLKNLSSEGARVSEEKDGSLKIDLELFAPMAEDLDLVERPTFSVEIRSKAGRFYLQPTVDKLRENALAIRGDPRSSRNWGAWEALGKLCYEKGAEAAQKLFAGANASRADQRELWREFMAELEAGTPLREVQKLVAWPDKSANENR